MSKSKEIDINKIALFIFAVVIIFIDIMLWINVLPYFLQTFRMNYFISTEGTICNSDYSFKTFHQDFDGAHKTSGAIHSLWIEFEVNGEIYELKPIGLPKTNKHDSIVRIFYNPNNPQDASIDMKYHRLNIIKRIVINTALLILGIILLFRSLK